MTASEKHEIDSLIRDIAMRCPMWDGDREVERLRGHAWRFFALEPARRLLARMRRPGSLPLASNPLSLAAKEPLR